MTGESYIALVEFLFALVMGILYVSASLKKNTKSNFYLSKMILSHMVLLLLDAATYLMIGHGNLRPVMMVIWVLNYAYSMIVVIFFHLYVVSYTEERSQKPLKTYAGFYIVFFCIGVGLWILSAFNGMYYIIDENLMFHYEKYHLVSQALVVAMVVPDLVIFLVRARTLGIKRILLWSSFVVFPTVTRFFDFIEGFPFTYLAIAFSILVCYVMINQDLEISFNQQQMELARKSVELQDMNQKVMISQIQPHFLYNVLNTICFLCRKDPKAAAQTTADFAAYLRVNLNALSKDEPVFFDEELDHVETYLRLEQQRFGEDLKVEYDIKVRNFFLPVLSLQPLVENSVKHGVCQDMEGGVVKISTRDDGGVYTVVVEDNGVGFDVSTLSSTDEDHVGLANTRRRVRSMCHGDMIVESTIGQGTKVTILLPKASNSSFLEKRGSKV